MTSSDTDVIRDGAGGEYKNQGFLDGTQDPGSDIPAAEIVVAPASFVPALRMAYAATAVKHRFHRRSSSSQVRR